MQKTASIVFSKSKPESPGPGDLALEEKQKKSQLLLTRAKTEIRHRKMQPWSHFNCVHPNLSNLFLLLSFSFSILNRQRDTGRVLLWIFRVEPLRGKLQGSTLFFPHFSILSTFCQECCQRIVFKYHPHLCDSNIMHTVRPERCILIMYIVDFDCVHSKQKY